MIDEATLTTTEWAALTNVYSLAVDSSGTKLYVATLLVGPRPLVTSNLSQLDASTGDQNAFEIMSSAAGRPGPSSVAIVPALGDILALDGANAYSLNPLPGSPSGGNISAVSITSTAEAVAVDPTTSVAYITEPDSGAVAVVDAKGGDDMPGAPSITTATAGDRSISVGWTGPADPGSSPVTAYLVSAQPADGSLAAVQWATSDNAVITGLQNWMPYRVTVTAVNAFDGGTPSVATDLTPIGPVLTTTTTVHAPPAYYGSPTTVTATIQPAAAGGTVAFSENGRPISDCGAVPVSAGTATCTFAQSDGGSPAITAAYSGFNGYSPSTGSAIQVVTSPPCPTGVTHQATGTPIGTTTMTGMVHGVMCPGYWVVTDRGGVTAVGAAPWHNDLNGIDQLASPIVAMGATGNSGGYVLVAADGGVFSFGNAQFYGSPAQLHLTAPLVAIAFTPDGKGYWMTASDGGVFAYGDAQFEGSTGGIHLYRPIVSMSVDQATGGYWLTASDGGVFAFHAPFFGSTGNIKLAKPIVSMSPSANDRGYRFVASDGGVFAFGQAPFYGSLGGRPANAPGVGAMSTSIINDGYYLFDDASRIWSFGKVPHLG